MSHVPRSCCTDRTYSSPTEALRDSLREDRARHVTFGLKTECTTGLRVSSRPAESAFDSLFRCDPVERSKHCLVSGYHAAHRAVNPAEFSAIATSAVAVGRHRGSLV